MKEKTKTLQQLAEMVDGEVRGDPGLLISGVGDIHNALPGEITFIVKKSMTPLLNETRAAAVIAPLDAVVEGLPALLVRDPYLATTIIQNDLCRRPFAGAGVSKAAHIGNDCILPHEVSIGPMVVLGERVSLGERVDLKPGVVIGDDVVIGEDTVLYPHVTVGDGCRIGSRVIVHSGTVIGSDGFGYATDTSGHHVKRLHKGIVQIDDDVEIGANVCVDRATFGKTWIKRGTKIDNLVQVAHNVEIGEDSLMVAQSGIAGSTTLGRGVVMGGRSAVAGHLIVGDQVVVAGMAGVTGSQESGAVVSGMPAIPHKKWLRASIVFSKLPDMVKDIRELQKKLAKLCGKGPAAQGHEE